MLDLSAHPGIVPQPDLDGERLAVWLQMYKAELEEAIKRYPQEYGYGVEDLPKVFPRMEAAFIKGSFNKDSRAVKAVCKALGIPCTYKAITGYLTRGKRS